MSEAGYSKTRNIFYGRHRKVPVYKIKEVNMAKEDNVVIIVKWEGFTESTYEKVVEEINLKGDPPKGLLLHVASFDDKGLRVTDVFETEEDFHNFTKDRLMPVAGEMVKTEPEIEIYPLTAYFFFPPVKETS
jgi:hypothetical protein